MASTLGRGRQGETTMTMSPNLSLAGRALELALVESAAAMGGVQFSTINLAQHLAKQEWSPVVISPEEGDLTNICRESKIPVCVVNQPRLRSTSIRIGPDLRAPNPAALVWNVCAVVVAARRLAKHLAKHRPDVIVTKGLSAHFIGGFAARWLRIPCVWHLQDFISERTFGIYRRVFSVAARWIPQQIIVDGASIAEQLPSLRSRIIVVHNGIDTDLFHPEVDGSEIREQLSIPENHLVIGHIGRVTPWKGQHYLIEAFARIAAKFANATLVLVGAPVFDNDVYMQRLKNLATQLCVADRVRFAGYRHDTAQVLAAMNVLAFTSTEKDTSPLVFVSAMSAGLPIVAFDIPGIRELKSTEDSFVLVKSKDVAALADEVQKLLSDEEARARLGRSARAQALAEFSLDKYASQMSEAIRGALNSEPHTASTELARYRHSASPSA